MNTRTKPLHESEQVFMLFPNHTIFGDFFIHTYYFIPCFENMHYVEMIRMR